MDIYKKSTNPNKKITLDFEIPLLNIYVYIHQLAQQQQVIKMSSIIHAPPTSSHPPSKNWIRVYTSKEKQRRKRTCADEPGMLSNKFSSVPSIRSTAPANGAPRIAITVQTELQSCGTGSPSGGRRAKINGASNGYL